MKQLLNDLQNRLTARVTALRYIDFNNGQLEQDMPPIQWPCALIDIPSTEWSNQGRQAQIGLVQIVITYYNLRLTNSSAKAPQTHKDFYLQNLDHVRTIHAALHGWAGSPHYSPLVRTQSTKKKSFDFVEIDITFTTSLYDTAASPTQGSLHLDPHVGGEILRNE